MNALISRMAWVVLSLVLYAGILLLGSSLQAAPRPNILLIMSDDMGFSDIGCYGGEIKTPNLDSLAASGVRFTQFYNNCRCCPTRASVLTGLYPHEAGIGHMMEDRGEPGYRGNLNRQCVTIAQVMQAAGYRTYMCGKWHVTRFMSRDGDKSNWPLQRGFEKFYGTITGGGSFYDPTTLCRQNTYITPENDSEYKPGKFYYTDALSDNAIRFLDQHVKESAGQPFFMYLAYTAAHWPMHALPEDIAKYKGKYDNGYGPARKNRLDRLKKLGLIKPGWHLSPTAGDWASVELKDWEQRCMEVYAAMVDRMDQGIGRIVAQLKQTAQLDNTVIFFLEDNGGCAEDMGRKVPTDQPTEPPKPFGPDDLQPKVWPPMQTRDGRWVRRGPGVMPGPEDTYVAYGKNWANVSNTPFREYKHWVHEGGISTPLIVHWPAGIPANRRGKLETQPAHITDLMSTCVDLGKAEYPKEATGEKIKPMEGISLAPAFQGQPLNRKEPIFWEHESNRAVRDGKWKLVSKADQPWELYDMDADRTEMHDLAGAHPELVKSMSRKWEAWAARANVLPLGAWRNAEVRGNKKGGPKQAAAPGQPPLDPGQVRVVDGVVQPRRPVTVAIRDAMQFLKKADGAYVPGRIDGDLAGYFTSAHVNPDGTRSDRKVSFPARQHAYFINTFLKYHVYSGEKEWLLRARDLGDWELAHSTPADALYARLPYSTMTDSKPGGSRDGNSIEPDKAAFFGSAYLALHEATREPKYLEGAKAIAATLVKTQRPDGSWPFRVFPQTGEIREDFGGAPVFYVEFFEGLKKYADTPANRGAGEKALALMLDRNAKKNLWGTYHEDVKEKTQEYPSAEPICFTLSYLFRNARAHPEYLDLGREVLRSFESRLVYTNGHAAAPAPAVSEQAGFEHLMPGHTARYCRALADLYAITGDVNVKCRALSGINAVTYMQSPPGLFRTFFYSVKPNTANPNRPDWYSQHLYTVCHVLEAMPLLPELK